MTSSEVPLSPPSPPSRLYVPRHGLFFLLLLALLVANFTLLRAALMWRNPPGPTETLADLHRAYWIGVRFDLVTSAYILIPFVVLTTLPWFRLDRSRKNRRRFFVLFSLAIAVVIGIALGEFEFFHEFQSRYNQLAVKYLDQAKTVTGMVFQGFPVFRYTAAILLWSAWFSGVLWVAMRLFFRRPLPDKDDKRQVGLHALSYAATWVGLVLCMRGGLQHEPIRWGDAFKSNSAYANEMGLNGTYTLGRTLIDYYLSSNASAKWIKGFPKDEAQKIAREMVLSPSDEALDATHSDVTRVLRSKNRSISLAPTGRKPNVVVVLMESFSARFCGAVGAPESMSPNLDALARDGVLFRRAFSAGTHTHQGVFSTLLGFPNLPGYEDLMQDSMSRQPFSSIPSVLKENGYRTLFLYNGDFNWDNMYGMFRDHGIDRFIGRKEFQKEHPENTVWGANDHDVFERANAEFEAMDKSGPFCGVILTLSNHAPFDLPRPLPFDRTTGHGDLDERLDGYRYADWAVGRFVEEARKLGYYKNTVFVFVGDHGFATRPVLTDVNLLFHHVPLIIHSPLLPRGVARDEVAMQADVAPTLFGLLKVQTPVANWGRDLFSTDYADENFAYFKDSGGGKAVALARGDKVYLINNAGQPQLFKFDLGFPASITPVVDKALQRTMDRQLRGFLAAALNDLTEHDAGPEPKTEVSAR